MMSDYTADDPALAPEHDSRVQLNTRYLCAIVGVVKCLQLILGLITLICAGVHLSCSEVNMTTTTAPITTPNTISFSTTTLLVTTVSPTSNTATSLTTETGTMTTTTETGTTTTTTETGTTTTTTPTTTTTKSGKKRVKRSVENELQQANSEVLRDSEPENLFYSTIGAYGIGFVLFAGSVCFIGTFILLLTNSCNLRHACCSRLSQSQLHNLEFYFTIIATLLYLISFGVQAWYSASWTNKSYTCNKQAWEAAAAFAFFTLVAYMVGFYTVIKQPR